MTELDAARWLQKQAGIVITVYKDGRVALFMEGLLFCKGEGFLGAVIKARKILESPTEVKTGANTCNPA